MKKAIIIPILTVLISIICGCSSSNGTEPDFEIKRYTANSNGVDHIGDMTFPVCKGWEIDKSVENEVNINADIGKLTIGVSEKSVEQLISINDQKRTSDTLWGLPTSSGYIDDEVAGQPAKRCGYQYGVNSEDNLDSNKPKRGDVVYLIPYHNRTYYINYVLDYFDNSGAEAPTKYVFFEFLPKIRFE